MVDLNFINNESTDKKPKQLPLELLVRYGLRQAALRILPCQARPKTARKPSR